MHLPSLHALHIGVPGTQAGSSHADRDNDSSDCLLEGDSDSESPLQPPNAKMSRIWSAFQKERNSRALSAAPPPVPMPSPPKRPEPLSFVCPILRYNNMYSSHVGRVQTALMGEFEPKLLPIIDHLKKYIEGTRSKASNPRGTYNTFIPSAKTVLEEGEFTILRNFVHNRLSKVPDDFSIRFPIEKESSETQELCHTLEASYYGFGPEIYAAFPVDSSDWAYLMPTGWEDGAKLKLVVGIRSEEEEIGNAMCQTMRSASEHGYFMGDLKMGNMIFKKVNNTWTARMIDFDAGFLHAYDAPLSPSIDCIEVLHCLLMLVPHTADLSTAPLGIYQVARRLRTIRNNHEAALKVLPCIGVDTARPVILLSDDDDTPTLFLTQGMHYLREYAKQTLRPEFFTNVYEKLITERDNTLESWIDTTLELYGMSGDTRA